jgi:hypothetical protein
MKLWSPKRRRLPRNAAGRGEQEAAEAKAYREGKQKRPHRVAFYLAKVKAAGQRPRHED